MSDQSILQPSFIVKGKTINTLVDNFNNSDSFWRLLCEQKQRKTSINKTSNVDKSLEMKEIKKWAFYDQRAI